MYEVTNLGDQQRHLLPLPHLLQKFYRPCKLDAAPWCNPPLAADSDQAVAIYFENLVT